MTLTTKGASSWLDDEQNGHAGIQSVQLVPSLSIHVVVNDAPQSDVLAETPYKFVRIRDDELQSVDVQHVETPFKFAKTHVVGLPVVGLLVVALQPVVVVTEQSAVCDEKRLAEPILADVMAQNVVCADVPQEKPI